MSSALVVFSGGAAANPVGMVVSAANAHLGGANATLGADVYSGDFLDTDRGGTLRLKLGSTQVYLAEASAATVGQQSDRVNFKLARSTVAFSSAVAARFEVETPVGIVRAAEGKRAFGEVTITGPQKITVAAYRGAVVVEGAGISRTIKEGDAYNVTLIPDAATGIEASTVDPIRPSPPAPGLHRGGPGSLGFNLVVLGGVGGLGYFVWHHLTESDSTPQN